MRRAARWTSAVTASRTWAGVRVPSRYLGSYEHTGFTGVGGLFMSMLLGRVRTKMLSQRLPALLDDLADDGTLRPGSTLQARSLG
jgi:hypothetical protein